MYREVADLVEMFGLEAVNHASLTILGHPAVMVTNRIERHQISLKLRGIHPSDRPEEPEKPRRLLVSNKPKTQTTVQPKPQRQVAPSLF